MKAATLWIDPETRRIALRTSYDAAFVDALKKTIPWQCRSWNKEKKVWLVDISCKGMLEELLDTMGYQATDGTLPQEDVHEGGESMYHKMIYRLPFPVLKKVYRLIANECHPDKGGDTKIMAQVNVAWEAICEDRENGN